ncbi:hypothetical protein [Streptomyces sp. MMS20-AI2-20]|uniref:hypothetical protein n=1 Tax=Streptomyces sp. MMS20-AI2-20 TaxID=2925835 RepID=UPI001F625951|nr:hypothetical protein [Streptomyces sp. MMS20-AI2-20]MCI4143042.1 hypothetical protein [Streptomyces sp. MMS20-AI2-20]
MAFRRSVPQAELRAKMTPEQLETNATTYQPSRGGHFPPNQAQQQRATTEQEQQQGQQRA